MQTLTASETRRNHVLVVEDEHDHAAILVRWLRREKYAVTHTPTGDEGVKLARRGDYDLVLADLRLPGASGMDVIRVAKERCPWRPAVLMTSHGQVDAAVEAIRCRADDFLRKPLVRQDVVTRVDELVTRASPRTGELARTRGRTVLAVGAHPDDVEIGIGGILAKHRAQGDQVVVLTCTRGAAGGTAAKRVHESDQAARLLGAQLELGSLPDTRVPEGGATITLIERAVRRHGPDIVYTHSVNDLHQDHRAVHRASLVAARDVSNVYCYQSPSTTTAFHPTRFVDVGGQLDIKEALIRCYATQFATRPYLEPELIRSTARYWGRFAGYAEVEPLEVVRSRL